MKEITLPLCALLKVFKLRLKQTQPRCICRSRKKERKSSSHVANKVVCGSAFVVPFQRLGTRYSAVGSCLPHIGRQQTLLFIKFFFFRSSSSSFLLRRQGRSSRCVKLFTLTPLYCISNTLPFSQVSRNGSM